MSRRLWALALTLSSACDGSRSDEASGSRAASVSASAHGVATASAPLPKAAWIAKTARVLRYGEGVTDPDEMAALLPLSESEVVDRLMADPRFGDTVLDFNLYFLGFKPDTIYGDGAGARYAPAVLARPHAVTAARNLLTGGDYLALFDYEQPAWMPPVYPAYLPSDEAEGDRRDLSDQERRALLLERIRGGYDAALRAFEAAPGDALDREAGCQAFNDEAQMASIQESLFAAGLGVDLVLPVLVRWNVEVNIMCGTAVPTERIVAEIGRIKDRIAGLFRIADEHTIDRYRIESLLDLRAADLPAIDPVWWGNNTSFSGYWSLLQNSSTNFNRRRGAYVLKTYFCDDLTPIDVVQPDQHAGDQHASDPGCQACHYKLDPMAGFYRYRGFLGYDAKGKEVTFFDDNAALFGEQYAAYLDNWRAASEAGRVWNVGYVRSTTNPRLNTYEPAGPGGAEPDEPLQAMHRIIRQADEPKHCLVRRMAEYFVGTEQAFDGAWLASLKTRFDEEPSSAEAAKQVIKALVTSRAFRERNPIGTTCYDPPEAETRAVPCEIAHVLDQSCKSCHGRLFDLGDRDVLLDMHARLTTADPAARMPYRRDMPDTDRARLVRWLDERLSQGGATR